MNADNAKSGTERRILTGILIWGSTIAGLALLGFFSAIPRQLIALFAVLGIAIPSIVYFSSASLKGYFDRIGVRALTGFHAWRIGAGLLFVFYGNLGLLPETFVRNAGYGDIFVGVLAYLALLIPMNRAGYFLFHIIGLADFVLAVSTGLTLVLSGNPLMQNLAGLAVVLIPLFGVGVSGTAHLIAFDVLFRQGRTKAGLKTAAA